MKFIVPLFAIVVLVAIPYAGIEMVGLEYFFAVIFPYTALFLFMTGFIWRIFSWTRSAEPFNITTTAGQQKSLSWIKADNLESPHNIFGVIGRMALEIFLFRSLFRNTRAELTGDGRLVYGSAKVLWLGGLLFHWSFLIIFVRHFRFFLEPIPGILHQLEFFDGILQVGVPTLYLTDLILVGAATLLLMRRVILPQVRYISLAADFFPLFLIIAIAVTGILMRYLFRIDVIGVKNLIIGLIVFQPTLVSGLGTIFYIHFFLVCILFIYIPISKLMHAAGIFLSPTRNMSSNSREKRHVNPWNYPVKVHTYAEYEDDFREVMKSKGIPLEKEE